MLISLHIENFALVDCLDLEFHAGLNVLTGETGAGKSIILDALDLALGGKVSGRSLRTGTDKGRIDATFGLTPHLQVWLENHQLATSDATSFVCSRELTAGKGTGRNPVRNRSRINGIQVNKQQLEALRDRLVEITAQGQTVQLGQANVQRNWLDGLGGEDLVHQKEIVAQAYDQCQKAQQLLNKRRQREQQRQDQLDLFEFQAKELREANLDDPDELDKLEQERNRLSHAVELKQQSYEVYQALYQNDAGGVACADLLGKAQQTLADMATYDDQIRPMLEMVNDALAQVEEAGRSINTYGDGLETNPQQLQEVEARMMQLKQICRKYGPSLAEAIAYDQQLKGELAELSDGGQSLEALEADYAAKQEKLSQCCQTLTQIRQQAAKTLETALVKELKPLAMDNVQFQVEITPIPPTAAGSDRITFLFSPNPGEPLQPLSEVASGGEMSRFLLALKVCLAQTDDPVTMVFDEIDAGVSGRVTQAIAEKLYQLGTPSQVLCVTHQPLVAAMADAHFHVNKTIIQASRPSLDSSAEPTQISTAKQSSSKTGKKARAKGGTSAVAEAVVETVAEALVETVAEAKITETVSVGKTESFPSEPSTQQASGRPTQQTNERTVVRVTPLKGSQRKAELAQLAGGKRDDDAIAFAESLLSQAETVRNQLKGQA